MIAFLVGRQMDYRFVHRIEHLFRLGTFVQEYPRIRLRPCRQMDFRPFARRTYWPSVVVGRIVGEPRLSQFFRMPIGLL